MTAQRAKDWNEFAAKVAAPIENYTVPQYHSTAARQTTT